MLNNLNFLSTLHYYQDVISTVIAIIFRKRFNFLWAHHDESSQWHFCLWIQIKLQLKLSLTETVLKSGGCKLSLSATKYVCQFEWHGRITWPLRLRRPSKSMEIFGKTREAQWNTTFIVAVVLSSYRERVALSPTKRRVIFVGRVLKFYDDLRFRLLNWRRPRSDSLHDVYVFAPGGAFSYVHKDMSGWGEESSGQLAKNPELNWNNFQNWWLWAPQKEVNSQSLRAHIWKK